MPPDELTNNTDESLDDFLERTSSAFHEAARTIESMVPHIDRFVSSVAELKIMEAAKEVPDAIGDVGQHAVDTTGEATSAVAEGVGTVPAVATDVLEDAGEVEDTLKDAAKKGIGFRRRLKRR